MLFLFEKLICMVIFVVLHVDVHSPSERSFDVILPGLLSWGRKVLVEKTAEAAIRYELNLPQLQHVIQFYNVYVEPRNCSKPDHQATASLIVPWSHEDYHIFVSEAVQNAIPLRLQSSKSIDSNETAHLRLTLDPACRYHISVESSMTGTLGQFARFYSTFLFSYLAVAVLLCLKIQLRTIGLEGSCSFIFTALIGGIQPYVILAIAEMTSKVLGSSSGIFPTPDYALIENEGMDFFLLPLILYLIAVGIFWVLSLVVAVSLILCESTVQKFAVKILTRGFTGFTTASDYVLDGLHKLPTLVAVGLLLLCFATCGGLSLCLGAGFYYLKLAHMSQDFVEDLAFKFLRSVSGIFTRTEKTSNESMAEADSENAEDAIRGADKPDESPESKVEHEKDSKEADDVGMRDKEKEDVKADEQINSVENEEERESFDVGKGDADKRGETTKTVVDGALFFHFSIFLLWVLVACMSVPSVLTWAHNFKYGPTLSPDPFLYSGIFLALCAIPLWQLEMPIKEKTWYRELSIVVLVLTFTTLVYATLSIYRLQYFLTLTIVFIVLHQLLAPMKHRKEVQPDQLVYDVYKDKVKAKLE